MDEAFEIRLFAAWRRIFRVSSARGSYGYALFSKPGMKDSEYLIHSFKCVSWLVEGKSVHFVFKFE
jgi:hypothetical protein